MVESLVQVQVPALGSIVAAAALPGGGRITRQAIHARFVDHLVGVPRNQTNMGL